MLWDSTRLRLLVEIDRQRQRLGRRPRGRDRPAERERAPAPARGGRRAAARRAKRPRQPADRGRARPRRRTRARRSRRSRAGEEELARARRPRGRNDPHRRLDHPRRLPAPRHARLLPPRPPNVTVEVEIASTGEILDRLLAGRIQLALVGETGADERIAARAVPRRRDRRRRQARPPAQAEAASSSRTRSPRRRCSCARRARAPGRSPSARFAAAGVEPARVWELDSSEAIKRAAREGLGVAFLSRYAVAEEVERGELESFRLAGQPRSSGASTSPASRAARPARASAASSRPSRAAPRAPITQPRSWARDSGAGRGAKRFVAWRFRAAPLRRRGSPSQQSSPASIAACSSAIEAAPRGRARGTEPRRGTARESADQGRPSSPPARGCGSRRPPSSRTHSSTEEGASGPPPTAIVRRCS